MPSYADQGLQTIYEQSLSRGMNPGVAAANIARIQSGELDARKYVTRTLGLGYGEEGGYSNPYRPADKFQLAEGAEAREQRQGPVTEADLSAARLPSLAQGFNREAVLVDSRPYPWRVEGSPYDAYYTVYSGNAYSDLSPRLYRPGTVGDLMNYRGSRSVKSLDEITNLTVIPGANLVQRAAVNKQTGFLGSKSVVSSELSDRTASQLIGDLTLIGEERNLLNAEALAEHAEVSPPFSLKRGEYLLNQIGLGAGAALTTIALAPANPIESAKNLVVGSAKFVWDAPRKLYAMFEYAGGKGSVGEVRAAGQFFGQSAGAMIVFGKAFKLVQPITTRLSSGVSSAVRYTFGEHLFDPIKQVLNVVTNTKPVTGIAFTRIDLEGTKTAQTKMQPVSKIKVAFKNYDLIRGTKEIPVDRLLDKGATFVGSGRSVNELATYKNKVPILSVKTDYLGAGYFKFIYGNEGQFNVKGVTTPSMARYLNKLSGRYTYDSSVYGIGSQTIFQPRLKTSQVDLIFGSRGLLRSEQKTYLGLVARDNPNPDIQLEDVGVNKNLDFRVVRRSGVLSDKPGLSVFDMSFKAYEDKLGISKVAVRALQKGGTLAITGKEAYAGSARETKPAFTAATFKVVNKVQESIVSEEPYYISTRQLDLLAGKQIKPTLAVKLLELKNALESKAEYYSYKLGIKKLPELDPQMFDIRPPDGQTKGNTKNVGGGGSLLNNLDKALMPEEQAIARRLFTPRSELMAQRNLNVNLEENVGTEFNIEEIQAAISAAENRYPGFQALINPLKTTSATRNKVMSVTATANRAVNANVLKGINLIRSVNMVKAINASKAVQSYAGRSWLKNVSVTQVVNKAVTASKTAQASQQAQKSLNALKVINTRKNVDVNPTVNINVNASEESVKKKDKYLSRKAQQPLKLARGIVSDLFSKVVSLQSTGKATVPEYTEKNLREFTERRVLGRPLYPTKEIISRQAAYPKGVKLR